MTINGTVAQNKGDAEYLNTWANEAQVETMCNWVKRTGGTRGGRDVKREKDE